MSTRPAPNPGTGDDLLVAALRAGERAAIAKAISAVESRWPRGAAVSRGIRDALGRARVIGVTGAPGVGKSTLVGALIAELRRRQHSVGVVAVDPSSPISGGAILGDRVRMTAHGDDDGVFIRSMASRGRSGGLSLATARVVDVLDAAGYEFVIIETVGAGQSEIEVAEVADLTLVVSAPGLGDDIQAMKAGLLEIADILVVNKADDPLATVTANQLTAMLGLRQDARRRVPVLKTSASAGTGIAELTGTMEGFFKDFDPAVRAKRRRLRLQKLIAASAGDRLTQGIRNLRAAWLDRLCDDVAEGNLDLEDAARQVLLRDLWRDV